MTRSAWMSLAFLVVCPLSAAAQQAASGPALTSQQKLGRQLFNQSCLVCHTKPQITSGLYGPPLSRDTANGQADVVRGVIADGTPRMPGFKYQFTPDQIAAIADYVETLPPPAAPATGSNKGDVD